MPIRECAFSAIYFCWPEKSQGQINRTLSRGEFKKWQSSWHFHYLDFDFIFVQSIGWSIHVFTLSFSVTLPIFSTNWCNARTSTLLYSTCMRPFKVSRSASTSNCTLAISPKSIIGTQSRHNCCRMKKTSCFSIWTLARYRLYSSTLSIA